MENLNKFCNVIIGNKFICQIKVNILKKLKNTILYKRYLIQDHCNIFLDERSITADDFIKYVLPLLSNDNENSKISLPKIKFLDKKEIKKVNKIYEHLNLPLIDNLNYDVQNFNIHEILLIFDQNRNYEMDQYTQIIYDMILNLIKINKLENNCGSILIPLQIKKLDTILKYVDKDCLYNLISKIFENCKFLKLNYVVDENSMKNFNKIFNLKKKDFLNEFPLKNNQNLYPCIKNKKIESSNNTFIEYSMRMDTIIEYSNPLIRFKNNLVCMNYEIEFVQLKINY